MSPERTSPKIKVKILSNEAFSQEDLTKAQQQLPQYSATSQYPMGSIAVNTSGNQHQQHFHGGNSDVGGDFVATPTMPPVEYRMSMDQTAMQIRNDSIDASNNHAHSGAVGTPSKKMDAFADDPQSGSKKSKAPKHKIHGNTPVVMALLSEMWIVHIAFILGFTYLMTFVAPQNYLDGDLWNNSCYWKIGIISKYALILNF